MIDSLRLLFMHWNRDSNNLNATRMSIARCGWTQRNLYLLPQGADANESLPAYATHKVAAIPQSACLTDSALYPNSIRTIAPNIKPELPKGCSGFCSINIQ